MSFFLHTQSSSLAVIFHFLPHWGFLRVIVKVGQDKKTDVVVRMAQAGKGYLPPLLSNESTLRRVEVDGGKG